MPIFLKSGLKFRVTTKEAMDLHERLPVGAYTVGLDQCSGQFFLEQIDSFEIKKKLYGNTTRHADRILQTFYDREASTGVLLAGEKGSGKTLLAKSISMKAAEAGIPTIVVNKDWCGEEFNAFLQMIEQPTVIVFDEFEKVYDTEKQEKMLTLLDGVYPSKKLFVLTCNDKWRIDNNMRNRPGRIFYFLEFSGLEEAAIREYCEENLNAKQYIPSICAISSMFHAFNFDMLQAMVEDMNRYDESPSEVLKYLNVRASFEDRESKYNVKLRVNGKDLEKDKEYCVEQNWQGNPMKREICITYYDPQRDNECIREHFSAGDLKSLDSRTGSYTFVNAKGVQLELIPKRQKFNLNYDSVPTIKTTFVTENATENEVIDIPMLSDVEESYY